MERAVPQVPEPFTVITGEERIIEEKQTTFFLEIADFLGYDQRAARAGMIRIEVRNLAFDGPMLHPSEDLIALLLVHDSLVATVIRHRDILNFVEARFAHYLYDPYYTDRVRFRDSSYRPNLD